MNRRQAAWRIADELVIGSLRLTAWAGVLVLLGFLAILVLLFVAFVVLLVIQTFQQSGPSTGLAVVGGTLLPPSLVCLWLSRRLRRRPASALIDAPAARYPAGGSALHDDEIECSEYEVWRREQGW